MRPTLRCLATVLALTALWPARVSAYSALYAFGDSLSDAGNLFIDTGGAYYGPPYYQGHPSNGLTWVEDLSLKLGLGQLTASQAGGNDYAYGFAFTGPALPGATTSIPDINQQVARFTTVTGGHAPSTGLYAVWVGGNDIIQAVTDVVGGMTPGAAAADLSLAAHDTAVAVNTLAGEGARHFIVPTVPDLAKVPDLRAVPALGPLATSLTAAYDAALLADVGALIGTDHIDVRFLDTDVLLNAIIADPAGFGLTDATDACYVGSLAGGGTVCAIPDQYMFWDGDHPSAAGHRLIADAAASAIPAPGGLPLFGAGAALAGVLRSLLRRRATPHRSRRWSTATRCPARPRRCA
jgi:phospholipase/lecithinase/hemolysin